MFLPYHNITSQSNTCCFFPSVPMTEILEKGEWKPPGHHYDFLAIMDKEKNKQKRGGHGDLEPGTFGKSTHTHFGTH